MHPNVHNSTIYSSQDMEAAKVPIKRWIAKKIRDIYVYAIYISIHRYATYISMPYKEWNFAIFNNMLGPVQHYAYWNKSDKDKYCKLSLICGV